MVNKETNMSDIFVVDSPIMEADKQNDVVFFFGAGAESDKKGFNLPSGSEYTYRTMQHRQDKLYKELCGFYRTRLPDGYVKEYRNSFLFERDSHTFREIIYRAALQYHSEGNESSGIADYDEFVKCALDVAKLSEEKRETEGNPEDLKTVKEELKRANDKLKEQAKKVYDRLIKKDRDSDKAIEAADSEGKSLKDYISYYGAVEKDFSAIINPDEVGLTQFWRVINYYWSAFFTILEPMCSNFEWYKELGSDKKAIYRYVLNNLKSVISSVYTAYDYDSIDKSRGNYYKHISEKYPNCMAVTTNYTPFVEHYFPENNVYLAGRLSEFEFPCELAVKKITEVELDDSSFIFPFLMTQAPIKPIIVANQIREYGTMLEGLGKANTLVIIGYSIGPADNHINAMLREYALERGKRIIYCYYDTENKKAPDDVCAEVLKDLKLSEHSAIHISCLKNNGNASELVSQLAHQLEIERLQ